jgi:hypothetical protein
MQKNQNKKQAVDRSGPPKLKHRTNQEQLDRLNKIYQAAFRQIDEARDTGWYAPPCIMPSAGELAIGVCYDPNRHTR